MKTSRLSDTTTTCSEPCLPSSVPVWWPPVLLMPMANCSPGGKMQRVWCGISATGRGTAESKCNKPNPFHDPMTLARGSSTKVQLNERSQPTRHAACERAEPTRTKQAHLDHTALKKISSLRRRDIATAPTHHFKKLQPRYGSMQAKGGLRGPYASGPRSRSCCARSSRPS